MGLFAPPAAFLSQRLGSRHALAAALALIGVFGVARAFVPGAALLILLTIPVGIGMGLGNALLPVGVKERFADRPVFATGVYAAGINIGATVSAAAAVPLERSLGDWRDPLLVFSVVTLGLLVLWLVLTRSERGRVAAPGRRPLALPWRSPLAWRLVAAFFCMSATYYGLNAWLPDVYVEHGWSEGEAGALLAVFNGTQIAAGLAVAWLADRMWSRRTWMAGCAGLAFLAVLGVVFLPDAGFLWAFVLGGTIGPLFSLTMALPLDVGRGPAEVAAYTGLMLGAGYTLSARVAVRPRRDPRRERRLRRRALGAARPHRRDLRDRLVAHAAAARSRSTVAPDPVLERRPLDPAERLVERCAVELVREGQERLLVDRDRDARRRRLDGRRDLCERADRPTEMEDARALGRRRAPPRRRRAPCRARTASASGRRRRSGSPRRPRPPPSRASARPSGRCRARGRRR